MNRAAKNVLFILFAVGVAALVLGGGPLFKGPAAPKKVDYTEAQRMIVRDEVSSAKINRDRLDFETKKGDKFYTDLDPMSQPVRASLVNDILTHKVQLTYEKPPISDAVLSFLLSVILPLGFLVVLYFLFMRQAQAGGNQAMSFGRSRARRAGESIPKVTFEDVAGVEEAKQELQEVVEFLKNPKKFQALGAKIPRGVLLLGPPGCGKTLLARAIAGEAGVPFFHISGSDFVEMFVGVGASRVRDLFDTAKANRPSLIFIDEIDAVGRQRGAGLGGGHDEREQTLNQLLVEMDGFDPNAGVILIAATNRPDVLDPALLRPGRFDRRVVVDNPDLTGRDAILRIHLRGKPLTDDVDVSNLARRTPGFSGADLANLVNEAALLAARRDQSKIQMNDFEDSVDRVIMGPERKSRLINESEKQTVAFHEVGHAIVMAKLINSDPVHKVSILPRGMALGYTMHMPTEDKYLVTKSELLDKIAGLLGGRAAEQLVFSEVSTGASNDLEHATEIARAMICEYGMSTAIGPRTLGRRHSNPFLGRDIMEDRNYSEEIAKAIDAEVRATIEEGYDRATLILTENRAKMDEIVAVLREKETIEGDEFNALLQGTEYTPPPPRVKEEPPTTPAEPQKSEPEVTGTANLEPGPA